MQNSSLLFIVFIGLAINAPLINAETVKLKNGKIIENCTPHRDGGKIIIEYQGSKLTLPESAVEILGKSPAPAAKALGSEDFEDLVALKNNLKTELLSAESNCDEEGKAALTTVSENEEYQATLMRHELLRICDEKKLTDFATDKNNREFLLRLLNDTEWLRLVLSSGPVKGEPVDVIKYLATIENLDPACRTKPINKHLAVAIALETADQGKYKNDIDAAVEVYDFYKTQHAARELNPIFSDLQAWEMRFVVHRIKRSDLEWYHENVNLPIQRYNGACWQTAYRLHNDFGESIHGRNFYSPWSDKMTWAENVKTHGGVCGSLSTFGTMQAQARGVPAITMGEPGHCAHAIRHARNNWKPSYTLHWKRGLHYSFTERTWQHLVCNEAAYCNEAENKQAQLHAWQAHLHQNKNPKRAFEAWELALAANPINISFWRECATWMLESKHAEKKHWLQFTKQAAAALQDYPETVWHLVRIYDRKALKPQMTNEEMTQFYADFHGLVTGKIGPIYWNLPDMMKYQCETLGKKNNDLAMQLYSKVLPVHRASADYLPNMITWGQERFGKDEKLASAFIKTVETSLSAGAGELNDDVFKKACAKAILAAEASNNPEAFQSLSDLGERYITPAKLPEFISFPGELLSENGLVKFSSTSKWDKPLEHRGLLLPKGGSFHTNKDKHPWVIARLGKIGELSGIVIINSASNSHRQVPLVVYVSEDGQQWQEIWRTDKNEKIWRIGLKDQNVRAAYIKVQQQKETNEYFHLRSILAYGRRLQ